MAANAGRALLIAYDPGTGAVDILGQTTGTITVNREPIDITTKSDDGVRTLLADLGTFGIDIAMEGVMEDTVLAALGFDDAPTALYDFDVTIGNLGTLSGSWFLGNFEVTGEDGANAITFSTTLMSSGSVTFTAL
jgi:predicted secreted protein